MRTLLVIAILSVTVEAYKLRSKRNAKEAVGAKIAKEIVGTQKLRNSKIIQALHSKTKALRAMRKALRSISKKRRQGQTITSDVPGVLNGQWEDENGGLYEMKNGLIHVKNKDGQQAFSNVQVNEGGQGQLTIEDTNDVTWRATVQGEEGDELITWENRDGGELTFFRPFEAEYGDYGDDYYGEYYGEDAGEDAGDVAVPVAGPMHMGCFKDGGDRAGKEPSGGKGSGNSKAQCNAACAEYEFFALQWTGECWCGNDEIMNKHGKSSECNECEKGKGEDGHNFGGWANCVFTVTPDAPAEKVRA